MTANAPARPNAKKNAGRIVMDSLKVHPGLTMETPRKQSVRVALGEVTIPGDFAQFGVYRGATARVIQSLMGEGRKLHLFDSFEGLPEDWFKQKPAGSFKLKEDEIPVFDSPAVVIHKGWFKDTAPGWAEAATTPLAFIHIDADLYSSTVDALFSINRLIVPGTVVLFDEYIGGGRDDEHRAFVDWMQKFGRTCEYLWRSSGLQACIRVTS